VLARRHRFHGLRSLDAVYRRGETIRGPYCLLRYSKNPKRRDYRVAVVVSKKVNKSAVVRNRIRRRVYELVRGHAPEGNLDIIITVFDEAVAIMPAEQLQKSLLRQLEELPKSSARSDNAIVE
jgi:ribonuclease P protein component